MISDPKRAGAVRLPNGKLLFFSKNDYEELLNKKTVFLSGVGWVKIVSGTETKIFIRNPNVGALADVPILKGIFPATQVIEVVNVRFIRGKRSQKIA